MKKLLVDYLEDHSTPQYFYFAIRCEVCGEFWYSTSIPFSKADQRKEFINKKELYDVLYQREKIRARSLAIKEAREVFSQCPICHRLVCDACFLVCTKVDLCKECADMMEEAGEPVTS